MAAPGPMHYTMTLNGSAQNVGAYLATNSLLTAAADGPYQQIDIYADDNNSTRIVYVGGSAAVSSTDYGVALDTEESFRIGPLGLSPGVRFRDLWVIGTNNDKVHFFAIPH